MMHSFAEERPEPEMTAGAVDYGENAKLSLMLGELNMQT